MQAWRDTLFLQYGLDPPYLPTYCDRCNAKFTIWHALDCKRGGLVTERHNELWDRVADIFAGLAVERTKANPSRDSGTTDRDGSPPPEVTEQKGDLLIRDF